MKFLVVSDIHGDTAWLSRLKDEMNQYDAVLCPGDFARFGAAETGLPVLTELAKMHDTIFAVLGNCDEPEFISELEDRDVSVQRDMVFRDGLVFAGSGGALKFTGVTPNERTDEELASDLRIIADQEENTADGWNNLILVLHQPPHNTACDKISAGFHVGSPLLRQFIETYKPLAAVCGHIHESAAIDTIGSTVVINPGSLAEGRYAVLEVQKKDGVWSVVLSGLRDMQ